MPIQLDNIGSGFNRAVIDNNFQKIEEEFNTNTLRRNGLSSLEDNSMQNSLDMNSFPILNLPSPIEDTSPVRLSDLRTVVNSINGGQGTVGDVPIKVYDNVAEMKASASVVGDLIHCKRYYEDGDYVEGLFYEVKESEVVDGYGDHSLINGQVAILIEEDVVNVKRYGAKGLDTDDNAPIQAALTKAGERSKIYIPKGVYRVTETILLDKLSQCLIGDGPSTSVLKTLSNTFDLIEVRGRSSYISQLGLVGPVELAENSGINYSAEAPHHYASHLSVQKFGYGIKTSNAVFSMQFDSVYVAICNYNWDIQYMLCGTFNNCYDSQAVTMGLRLVAARQCTFNSWNSGSVGVRHVNVDLNSYGIVFNGGNFELDTGSYDNATNNLERVIRVVSGSTVMLNCVQFSAPDAVTQGYLIEVGGNAFVKMVNPIIMSEGNNITHYRTLGNGRLFFEGKGNFTSSEEGSTIRVRDTYETAERSAIQVAYRSGSVGIIGDRVNSLVNNGPFTLPPASSLNSGDYIVVEKQQRYRTFEPVVNANTGDTIQTQAGSTTTLTFSGTEPLTRRFVSNGVDEWSI